MARLSSRRRRQLRSSQFIYPSVRKYPIHTKAQAKRALQLGARRDTYGSPATIRRKVYAKYPSLKRSSSSRRRTRSGKRGRSRR